MGPSSGPLLDSGEGFQTKGPLVWNAVVEVLPGGSIDSLFKTST